MGNQLCLTETSTTRQQQFQGSPNTKWNRDELKSGSQVQTVHDKENFFKLYKVGPSMPQYKNNKATQMWDNVLTNINSENTDQMATKISKSNSENFDELVMLGPPKQLRWSSWKVLLLDGRQFPSYDDMVNKPCIVEYSILKDLDRTLVHHPLFKQCGQPKLKNVLCAVANALPALGYCQGMNFVCAMLLIVSGCDESNAYLSMMAMLTSENHLMYYNFCEDMPHHHFMVQLIHLNIKEKYPKLSKKLVDVPDSMWISKMILSLFIYVFKLDDCVRAWDYLISRGMIRGIPELILGMIDILYDQLMTYQPEDFGMNFQGYENSSFDLNIGEVIYIAKQKNSISRGTVAKLAKLLRRQHHNNLLDLLIHYSNRESYKKQVDYTLNTLLL